MLHIVPVHLHQPVSGSESGQLGRGAGLHLPDELSASVLLSVQVEAIPALCSHQETEPGSSELQLHVKESEQLGSVREVAGSLIQRASEDKTVIIVQHRAKSTPQYCNPHKLRWDSPNKEEEQN